MGWWEFDKAIYQEKNKVDQTLTNFEGCKWSFK